MYEFDLGILNSERAYDANTVADKLRELLFMPVVGVSRALSDSPQG